MTNLNYVTAAEAVQNIQSGERVFLHSAAATPQLLVDAMTARGEELRAVELVSIHTEGSAPYLDPRYEGVFHLNTFFVGANTREAVANGMASYVPVFLSEIPKLFRSGIMPLDVAMVQVSPPDKHGYCSVGVSVDITNAAIETAKHVIAQVNENMPRVHGNGIIHVSAIDALVECNQPVFEIPPPALTPTDEKIGSFFAGLVEDGATLQTGIGGVPDAALRALRGHRNLGMHSEMFSDGVMALVECGALNGHNKKRQWGKIVSGFCIGSRALYDFVDDNPMIEMRDISYVNDTSVIRTNPKVTAINSALEVDITGQVCADSLGSRQYSGVGGQVDFIRGAALSEGGKPIIALNSVTSRGQSRIVTQLKPGASVTTSRAHVHYVVTEYGVAYLYGKNLRQRASALIAIAHPDHREQLERDAYSIFHRH
ncbi:MAG: acetyl-CoA hydrolase/transferase family protein [Halioglobus sp.]|nr:acetyl-CoA hydrolase/transferase family protein [Halioglobus sp.]